MKIIKKTLSVIIRTYNEDKHIGRLIDSLRCQSGSIAKDMEIIAVDSGSTDSTVDILKANQIKTITIAQEQFNYSKALNLGIDHSIGELLIILSAHSVPCESDWLERVIGHFEDEKVAGVYCRQVPWPDASPIEALRVNRTFGKESMTFCGSESADVMKFSNAASCIRRNLWKRHRFVILPAAEDREWSKWALDSGYKIIYDSRTKVYHSHNESPRKEAQRVIEIERAVDIKDRPRRNILFTIKQSAGWLVRDIGQIFSSNYSSRNKFQHSRKSFAKSFWYILDFNRKV
ncbi:glycosyltransferase [Planctomycetota bacterium]